MLTSQDQRVQAATSPVPGVQLIYGVGMGQERKRLLEVLEDIHPGS